MATSTELRNCCASRTASRSGTATDAWEPQAQPQCGSFAEPEALPGVLDQEVLEEEDEAPLKPPNGISILKELFPDHAGGSPNLLLHVPSPCRSRSLPVAADVPPVTSVPEGPGAPPAAHKPSPWDPISGMQAACYRDRLRARGQSALQRGFDRGLMPKAMRQAGPPPVMAGPPPGPLPTLDECAARHHAVAPQMCVRGPQTCFWGASQGPQYASQGQPFAYWGAPAAAVQAPVMIPHTMALHMAQQQAQQLQMQMQIHMQVQMPPQAQQAPQAPQVPQAEMAPQAQQASPQAQPQSQPNPDLMASLLPHCSFPLNRMEMAARLMTAADCQYED